MNLAKRRRLRQNKRTMRRLTILFSLAAILLALVLPALGYAPQPTRISVCELFESDTPVNGLTPKTFEKWSRGQSFYGSLQLKYGTLKTPVPVYEWLCIASISNPTPRTSTQLSQNYIKPQGQNPGYHEILLYGGTDDQGQPLNDTWSGRFDRDGRFLWTQLADGPGARDGHAVCFLDVKNSNQSAGILYDQRGNRIRDSQHSYEYDARGHQTRILSRDGRDTLGEFLYDATGKRVKTDFGGEVTYHYYLGEQPHIAIKEDGSYRLYVYMEGRLVSGYDYDASGDTGAIHYYHTDHLGSVCAITDAAGAKIWPTTDQNDGILQRYHPYGGGMLNTPFVSPNDVDAPNPAFTGKSMDPDTNIHYFNARQYSGTFGKQMGAPQFFSPDVVRGNVGDPLSWNRYGYCRGNPINLIDPTGMLYGSRDEVPDELLGWEAQSGQQIPGGLFGETPSPDAPSDSPLNNMWPYLLIYGTVDQIVTDTAVHIEHGGEGIGGGAVTRYGPAVVGVGQIAGTAWAVWEMGYVVQAMTTTAAPEVALTTSERIAQNKLNGDAARDRIASRFPGSRTEVSLDTTDGKRYLDVLTQEGLSIESKLGRTSLSSSVRRQVLKDVELQRDPLSPVNKIQWEFSRSPITNKIGPTRPLEEFLKYNDIIMRINQ